MCGPPRALHQTSLVLITSQVLLMVITLPIVNAPGERT